MICKTSAAAVCCANASLCSAVPIKLVSGLSKLAPQLGNGLVVARPVGAHRVIPDGFVIELEFTDQRLASGLAP